MIKTKKELWEKTAGIFTLAGELFATTGYHSNNPDEPLTREDRIKWVVAFRKMYDEMDNVYEQMPPY